MSLSRHIPLAVLAGLLLVGQASAQGPTGNVAGRVVTATTEEPVVGAAVNIADRGTVTDDNGRFTIANVPVGTHTLTASHVAFGEARRQVTVRAGETSVMLLSMSPEAVELSELVVVGYGQQETSDITGVIEQVSPEEFNTGRIVNAAELIQGKVAGVQIIDSGEPGGGISIRIRGGTSITSSNEPLFVIDGMPVAVGGGISAGRNPLNFLNPDDIESMTILKDASATAIYGSRGANGVVLIETRGGSGVGAEGSQLTYNGSISTSAVEREPDMLTAAQFRQAVADWAGPATSALLGDADTDWRDAVQRNGTGHDHSVAFSGASGDLSYRLSVGYLDQQGVLRGTNVERATLGLNYGQNFFDNQVRITTNIKGSHTNDDFTPGGVIGGATAFAPTQPIMDDTSSYGGFFEWETQQALNNPVAELELVTDEGTTYRSLGDIEASADIPFLRGLTGTVRLGYDVTKAEREVFRPSFLRGEAEGATPGFVSRSNSTQLNRLLDAFLYYGTRLDGFGADIDFTAGYSYEDSNGEFPYFEAEGLSFDYLGTNGVPAAEQTRQSIWVDESRLIAFFGRTNVSLNDRYMMTLSLRRDGSSKFGPDEQWGLFPSAGFAWRVSQESFMQDMDFLSDLKLRASWGVNGNQSFGNYLQYPSYDIGEPTAQYQFGDDFVTTIRPTAVDRGIKWEETTSYNLGIDYGFADNRFTGSIEYYFKETEDLIFRVPVPAGTFTSNFVTTNIGTLENQGFEFSIDAAVFEGEGGGFWWNAGFNASTNDNQIVEINPFGSGSEIILVGGISGGVGNNIQVLTPGVEAYSFYVYRHRLDADGRPVYADLDGDQSIDDAERLLMYEDVNEDGIINQDDRVPFESPAPNWIFGHTSRMGFGNFDAGFTVRAHLGNYVYNNIASNNGHYRALSYVVAPNNLHASVLETGFADEQYFSDYYVEDASFLRMDNVTLGYTLPPLAGGQQVRLFGTVQNVFTLTEYRGVDPLGTNNGIDNNLYPRSRTFTAGANVRF